MFISAQLQTILSLQASRPTEPENRALLAQCSRVCISVISWLVTTLTDICLRLYRQVHILVTLFLKSKMKFGCSYKSNLSCILRYARLWCNNVEFLGQQTFFGRLFKCSPFLPVSTFHSWHISSFVFFSLALA